MSTTHSPLLVRAWMHSPVRVAHPEDSIARARELCEQHRVNQLPVVTDGRLIGIVTDRDLRDAFPSIAEEIAAPAEAHGLTAMLRVEDVMTQAVLTASEDDGIGQVATIMRRERIGALPVVRDGRLVGIVTRTDLLGALLALAQSGPAPAAL